MGGWILFPFTKMGSLRRKQVFGRKSETYFVQVLFEMPVRHPGGGGKLTVDK